MADQLRRVRGGPPLPGPLADRSPPRRDAVDDAAQRIARHLARRRRRADAAVLAYSAFEVNGRTTAPRLLVEYLDEDYATRLGTGVLYKSLASSDFSYKGEDQTEYTQDFTQVNRKGEQDLQPVIGPVKWVEQASDESTGTCTPSWVATGRR